MCALFWYVLCVLPLQSTTFPRHSVGSAGQITNYSLVCIAFSAHLFSSTASILTLNCQRIVYILCWTLSLCAIWYSCYSCSAALLCYLGQFVRPYGNLSVRRLLTHLIHNCQHYLPDKFKVINWNIKSYKLMWLLRDSHKLNSIFRLRRIVISALHFYAVAFSNASINHNARQIL